MDEYTDEELRERLEDYGQDVGPINNSTRTYWQKSLTKLLRLENGVSPKCSSEKKVKKKTPVSQTNRRNAKCRSRSVGSPKYAKKYADRSFSENDISDWEFDSILTDSPGSTPFPAKISHNKKSVSNKMISPSGALGRPESISRDINRQKHLSMTPNTTKSNEEINLRKSTLIRQTDRELRDKLKEFGIRIQQGPMNETTRIEWRKRLDKLMSGSPTVESNSDSEIIYPSSYGSGIRIKPCHGTVGIRNIRDEEYEDLDYSKIEFESCTQNTHRSDGYFYVCLKFFFRIIFNLMFIIVVLIAVVLLVSIPEDDETFEADDLVQGGNISLQ